MERVAVKIGMIARRTTQVIAGYEANERNTASARFYHNPYGRGLCRRSAVSGS